MQSTEQAGPETTESTRSAEPAAELELSSEAQQVRELNQNLLTKTTTVDAVVAELLDNPTLQAFLGLFSEPFLSEIRKRLLDD